MKLQSLLDSIQVEERHYADIADLEISGIQFNSKKIEPNQIFVAIPGNETDGHHFIDDAIRAGASIIIGEKSVEPVPVPYFQVENSRKALSKLASCFYGNPSEKHTLIGITGTNGKTTTTYMLRHILEQSGISCSLIGTVVHFINGEEIPSVNTTPDTLTLHQLISKSQDQVVIMEVSSHGLDQGRVDGIEFDFALFTNLTHDHLNYHGTIENYFEVKSKLFQQLKPNGEAIVCNFCEWGSLLIDRLKADNKNVLSIGEKKDDFLRLQRMETEFSSFFELKEDMGKYNLDLPMDGIHNVRNASLSFLAARRYGLDSNDVLGALKQFTGVPGRFEKYTHPFGVTFIVDYAHTPDGLFHCLETVKTLGANRIIHIFGFRGNGDRSKRKEMISISAEYSSLYILTFDDLNGKEENEMKKELESLNGTYGSTNGIVIADRTLAIQHAWKQAKEGDWIVITGKGPEKYKQSFALSTTTDQETIQLLTVPEENIT